MNDTPIRGRIRIQRDTKTITVDTDLAPPGWTPWSRVHPDTLSAEYGIGIDADGLSVSDLYEYIKYEYNQETKEIFFDGDIKE